ncbi:MAG TPA: hypothetical protein VK155_19805 [Bacteroidales bacterium]|nr:hypothetical protein [Bacteroidales bacterium]
MKAIDRINEYTSGYKSADEFNEDYRNFDATMMNFVVIGEMVESDENERSCQRPPVAQKQKLPLTAGQLALIEADYQHFGFHAVKMSQRNRTTHSSFILDLIY